MTGPAPTSWAVVGGGVLGLRLALHLADAGHRVTVFEAAPEAGGLAAAWQLPTPAGPVTWDRHYHVILGSDAATLGLVDDLGLSPLLRWGATRTACFADGRLHEVTTPWQLLRLPSLPPVDRVRVGLSLAATTLTRDPEALDDMPLERWLVRWAGRRAYDRFWLPLLRAKLGDAHRDTSAAFIWATVQRLARARGRGMADERFGWVEGGWATVLDALVAALRARGVDVRTSAAVQQVLPAPGDADGATLQVVTADGTTHAFHRVVCTATGPAVARMVPSLSPAERDTLDGIPYQGVVCASVLLRRPLSGHYLTNITDEGELTGVVEMTSLVPPAALGGHHLVYLPRYVPPDHPLLRADDDEIRRRFLGELRRIHPGLDDDDVVAFRVSRVARVFAVPERRYRRHVLPFSTSVPGLFVVHGAQIVHGTLNVDETLQLAERALPVLLHAGHRAAAVPATTVVR